MRIRIPKCMRKIILIGLFFRTAEYVEFAPSPPLRERTRERVTTEHLRVDASPRTSQAFIVEASPSRHRSRSRHYADEYEEIVERPRRRGISRRRAVSVHDRGPRILSPVEYIEERELDSPRTSSMVVVRPRDSDDDVNEYIRNLEEETRLLRIERQGGIEITRQRETDIIDERGNQEEVTEVRRQERSGTTPQITIHTPSVILTFSRTQLPHHACYDGHSDLT